MSEELGALIVQESWLVCCGWRGVRLAERGATSGCFGLQPRFLLASAAPCAGRHVAITS